ncbi:MAG: hypothetical protein AB7K71_05620 [Polyangiaceae bacterium]
MRTAIYASVLACVACGGEARQAAPPSAPSQSEPSAPASKLQEPTANSRLEVLTEGSTDDSSFAPPEFTTGIWVEASCRGEELDLASIRKLGQCPAEKPPDLPAPESLELEAPEPALVPHGKAFRFKAQLVNRGDERVGFVVIARAFRPSTEVSKLRTDGGELEHECSNQDFATPEYHYVELEPGGKLSVSGQLYPNDALSVTTGDCEPSALTRGSEYRVELSVRVNETKLDADWSFKIK